MLNKKIVLGVLMGMASLTSLPSAHADYYHDNEGEYDGYHDRRYEPRYDYRYDNRYSHRPMKASTRSHRSSAKDQRTNHSPMPTKISGGNIIKVDLGRLAWGAYDAEGNLVKSGRASGGKSYCPDIGRGCRTVTGTYTIYRKQGAGCKSSRFPVGKGGAPMPYCMHFKGGYALHGSNSVPGYNASHGCVRVPPSDAQWLNQNFVRVGSTRVSITY